jgi:hypothetical protein
MTHTIDYAAPADLFPSRRYAKGLARYRRFSSAGEAIRYAIEEMPEGWLAGTSLDIDGIRLDASAIRQCYDAADFPLARVKAAA